MYTKQHPEFLTNIDWQLLTEQKKSLLETIDELENTSGDQNNIDNLIGILHLLDSIQDYAIDEMEVQENQVFGFEDDKGKKSIWYEVRADFQEQYIVFVDAWLTPDETEDGQTIAKINILNNNIEYLNECAKTDIKAQEVINSAIKLYCDKK